MLTTKQRAVAHATVCVLAGTAMSLAAPAQRVSSRIATSAGVVTDERGVRANAVTLTPTVSLGTKRHFDATLSGSATQFERSAWQVGGTATVAARTGEFAGTTMTLNAGGGVSRTSYDVTFSVADATPAMEVARGRFMVFGGARVATGRTTVRTANSSPLPGGTTLVSMTRTSRAPVVGGQWLFGDAWSRVQGALSVRNERARVGDALVVDRTAGAGVAWRTVSLGALIGERQGPSEQLRYGSGSATIALSRALQFELAAGRYPSSPLTGAAAGRFVTTGLAWRFGAGAWERLPRPSGVRDPASGVTRLAIRAPDARWVDLYGDWNGWTPVPAQRAANGVWFVDLPLEPGEYRYAFRVNAVEWRVPEGAVAVSDGFGGKSAYVTVARRTARVASNSREET